MKKIIVLLTLLSVALLVFLGCSNNQSLSANKSNGNTASLSGRVVYSDENGNETSSVASATENTSNSFLNQDEAKNIALKDAGLDLPATTGLTCTLNMSNPPTYNICFNNSSSKYSYAINALDGHVISKSNEPASINTATTSNLYTNSSTFSQPSDYNISEQVAIQIAKDRVPGSNESNVSIHPNNGTYEGTINYDRFIYSFKISSSGEIIDWNCTPNYNS